MRVLFVRLGALLLLACLPVPAAASPADPRPFVASIYDKGREGDVWAQWLDAKQRARWFSPGLTALWAKCEALAKKSADGLGAIDFDVATNSQGMQVKSFRVETLANDGRRAVVAATLVPDNWQRRSERENVVRYDLVWKNGRWGIDDIHGVSEPKAWSFRQILTSYLH
jgi:hypothetical protein